MTESQKLALRASEIRTKMAELSAVEALTDEQTAEVSTLRAEYRDTETKIQAAIVADDTEETTTTEDSEGRELRALIEGSSAGEIMDATLNGAQTDGRTAELQTHFGLSPNMIPLELLREERGEREYRAVTPSPGEVGQTEQPVVQPIFADGEAAYLNVSMPTVASGEASFPVLTSRPTVGGPHKDSTAVAETTGAFTAESLEPERLQASFFWRRVDAAKFKQLDSALRQALRSGLSEALDAQMLAQIVTDVGRTDAAAKDTFSTYRSRLVYSQIEGRFARQESDVRLLVGSGTLANMAAAYRANSADDSVLDSLRRISSGVRVSPHIAAVEANKQDCLVRLGNRRDAVMPVWRGVTLIADEITKAGTGEIVVTAVLLAAFKVVRTGAFARVQTQHA